jgi:hypothetical protein
VNFIGTVGEADAGIKDGPAMMIDGLCNTSAT